MTRRQPGDRESCNGPKQIGARNREAESQAHHVSFPTNIHNFDIFTAFCHLEKHTSPWKIHFDIMLNCVKLSLNAKYEMVKLFLRKMKKKNKSWSFLSFNKERILLFVASKYFVFSNLKKMSESFQISLNPFFTILYLLCLKQKPGIRNILYLYLGT